MVFINKKTEYAKTTVASTSETGRKYEDLAVSFLKKKCYRILCRNYKKKSGEIDIICMDGDEIVFVEVKYRESRSYGGAEFAINEKKQERIRRTAEWFLKERGFSPNTFCRFDAVLIDGNEIEHVKNAW